MGRVAEGINSYLGSPSQRIVYVNKSGKIVSLRESMYLDSDGFWRLKIGINLWRENGAKRIAAVESGFYYPDQTVFFFLLMKRLSEEKILLKISGYDEEFIVDTKHRSKFIPFYKFIFKAILAHYKNMFRYIIEHGIVPNELGIDV